MRANRSTHRSLLPLTVFLALVASAVVAALATAAIVHRQERRLLGERADEVALVLTQAVVGLQSSLPTLAELGASPQTRRGFRRAAQLLLRGDVKAVGAARRTDGGFKALITFGDGAVAGAPLRGGRAKLAERALTSGVIVADLLREAGETRLALMSRGRGGVVAYEESAVHPAQPIPDTKGSPFNNLQLALYASSRADPARLIISSSGAPLAPAKSERRTIVVGADHWLMVTRAEEPLVGGFAHHLPWFVLLVGLIGSGLTTTLVFALTRRRAYALQLADERTVELRHALEDQQELEQAEREARETAEAANHAKSEFLSRMSHELRTPLNAIIGFGQVLEMDAADAAQAESVQHILRGGRHLLALINEILDISRIEAGELALSLEPVQLGDTVADVVSLVRPLAEEREIALRTETGDYGAEYVLADRQRLKQVLLNLVSNAIKYNRRGGRATVSLQPASSGRIRIAVSDEGPGIPAAGLDRLFEPFERLGAERGLIEGTGLGLALSKRLAELMGATISVDSEVGQGSRFSVELALTEAPATRGSSGEIPVPRGADGLPPGVLLYIEDNLSNVRLVETILARNPQVRLLPAMQGELGLELARQHRPDVILLDLHLPDMGGKDVLERLRSDPVTSGIPVFILSADATHGQIERLLANGAQGYLTKPLDVERFVDALRETLTGGIVEGRA
jgi:signal transduction histidine kinase/CheY-like chemotaxis protein